MRIACLRIPGFCVEALARAQPDLQGKAVAVIAGESSVQRIFQLNDPAKKNGVLPGMTLLEARSHCPGIVFRKRNLQLEKETQELLLELGFSFSPAVEEAAPGLVYVDIRGLDQLIGEETELVNQILDRARQARINLQIGIACTPSTAFYAASTADPVKVVEAGKERQFLDALPLDFLEAPEEFQEIFDLWGIRTFGELAALPEGELFERLGPEGRHWQERVRGLDPRPLAPRLLSTPFQESTELEWPLDCFEPLAFILSGLLDLICKRLEACCLAVDELRLTLRLEGGFQYERTLRLPFPMRSTKVLLSLLRLDLESHPPVSAISAVTLEALPARPRRVQFSLLEPALPCAEKLSRTLARLALLVGEENIGSPYLLNTHRPGAFRLVAFDASRQSPVISRQSSVASFPSSVATRHAPPATGHAMLFIPQLSLRRLNPAQLVGVRTEKKQPVEILASSIHSRLVTVSGPWRSSGDWWRKRSWQRDEWDVASEDGTLYRIYQQLDDKNWFIEGTYD